MRESDTDPHCAMAACAMMLAITIAALAGS